MKRLAEACKAVFCSLVLAVIMPSGTANAFSPETLQSVVSVLPVWPGKPQGGTDLPPGTAPEGSGIVIAAGGYIATAWHVVEPSESVDVRLADGRILKARIVGHDAASDIALLQVEADLPPLQLAKTARLAEPVCAVSNAFGLDLSVTCGVVSALHVSSAGFNGVEDFIQTDASANPGSSGGALVNAEGRLVGMVAAIFASKGDTDVGINFAISAPLLQRVVADLLDDGKVAYVKPGWRLAALPLDARQDRAGALVQEVQPEGTAAVGGVQAGDVLTGIAGRVIKSPRDAISALALFKTGEKAKVTVMRGATPQMLTLYFVADDTTAQAAEPVLEKRPDCPYPEPVCNARQAVFPIESYDPLASAVRVGNDLLVTNRHVIVDRDKATVLTPNGPVEAVVVASSYRDDLVLLRTAGLPKNSVILTPESGQSGDYNSSSYFTIGADVARQQIRVFEPGTLILPPADGATYGRLHVTSRMQPGVSGGALVNERGQLAGIAVGGGEGRYEALPVIQITRLIAGTRDDNAALIQEKLGEALLACLKAVDAAREAERGKPFEPGLVASLTENCRMSENPGELLDAGRLLATGRATDAAIGIHEAAVARVPNSINARISLLVSLQLGGRFSDMLAHARWLLGVTPDDPQALRFAIQSGVWGGDPKLAEAAYQKLLKANPGQAQAARRFIDQAPPPPPRR
ncbi:MAG: trypsin-like peptidase domain-containing protein [Rhizobiales bacterium]|nr:trypsin-like peptidase domain-containing protein [Hyphomicrobiales bacterium]